jgi:hypothetical protein
MTFLQFFNETTNLIHRELSWHKTLRNRVYQILTYIFSLQQHVIT